MKEFNIDLKCDRLSKETLENLLICFILAYQGKGSYCATEKLRDFLILFGFKVDETDQNITDRFLGFIGLKNVITINIEDMQNRSQEEVDRYIDFFGVAKHIGNQEKVAFLKSHLEHIY